MQNPFYGIYIFEYFILIYKLNIFKRKAKKQMIAKKVVNNALNHISALRNESYVF